MFLLSDSDDVHDDVVMKIVSNKIFYYAWIVVSVICRVMGMTDFGYFNISCSKCMERIC